MRVVLKRFFKKYVYHIIVIFLLTLLSIYMDSSDIYSSMKLQLQENKMLTSTDIGSFPNLAFSLLILIYVIKYFLKDNTLSIMPIKKNDILNSSFLIIFGYVTFNIIVESIIIDIILVNKDINTVAFISILFYCCKRVALTSIIISSFIPLQIYHEINQDSDSLVYGSLIVILEVSLIGYFSKNIKAILEINSYAIGLCLIALVIGVISYKASSIVFSRCSVIK
ncbi:hypothetical protein SAMN02745163_00826 [Clostridium cavendishii DSM 21758]|uniref:Uncharacterized protein n=1 Tax=Clostridium cavendishii DSM 21758 TaxID=1121302 RepID=A0A1M6EDL6_9CLOT|nr:hypothetical protein [Clostridium cavendishii]SHI83479.1 hypothetical protein SAMN02745163_00826 [Clostridium cavendishii DSM 21758]